LVRKENNFQNKIRMTKIITALLSVLFFYIPHNSHYAQTSLNIIPAPTNVTFEGESFEINDQTRILSNEHAFADATWFASWLSAATGHSYAAIKGELGPEMSNTIWISCGPPLSADVAEIKNLQPHIRKSLENRAPENYELVVTKNLIWIRASQSHGAFYGLQTLRQILPPNFENGLGQLPFQIQAMTISDNPRFEHRGMLLDCCRHFMSKEFILRYLDLLALHKMNVLHWHLTEDQGWRIEIKKYPQLTSTGAYRIEADGSRYGGFYTQEDIKEIVSYAEKLHITIIPEIEMPGHSVAAIASYPYLGCTGDSIPVENEWGVFKDIYCAGKESTFEFLEDVLDEVCALFPSRYIHIGGDEAPRFRWENCNHCQKRMKNEKLKTEAELQSYFNQRIANYLKTKNKTIIGWDEILEGGIPESAVIQSWRGIEGGVHAAEKGHKVVMSPTSHCYFDYSIQKIDIQKVYEFDPIPSTLNGSQSGLIIGGECNMWTEHTPQELIDQQVFPRILALSEVLWKYPTERNSEDFLKRVEKHLDRLDIMEVNYGFPSYPAEFKTTPTETGGIKVELEEKMSNVDITYRLIPGTEKWNTWSSPLEINESSVIETKATWRGRTFEPTMSTSLAIHKALGKEISLSYTPSSSYTGGGNSALVDGNKGNSNFRNGLWQAVQGQDMEMIIDLKESTSISEITCDWYHYSNAWIFRPKKVEFYGSDDGQKWKLLSQWQPEVADSQTGEITVTAGTASRINATFRYFKVKAFNNGPCPKWHDAPGQPSWLFCDEIEIH